MATSGPPPPHGKAAYTEALAMLARREWSEAQIRQRLARRGFDERAAEYAVARLKNEGAIDDRRVAEAIGRSQVSTKKRGRLRVREEIRRAGVSATIAQRAVDRLFEDVNDEALVEAALGRRLAAGETIADERQLARLYRYLVAQGFDPELVMRTLDARWRNRSVE